MRNKVRADSHSPTPLVKQNVDPRTRSQDRMGDEKPLEKMTMAKEIKETRMGGYSK